MKDTGAGPSQHSVPRGQRSALSDLWGFISLASVWPWTDGQSFTCSCWTCRNSAIASALQILKPAGDEDSCSLLMSCGQVVLQNSATVYGTRPRWLANNAPNRKLRVFWTAFVKYTLHTWLCDFSAAASRYLQLQHHWGETGYLTALIWGRQPGGIM